MPEKTARIVLPLLIALLAMSGLFFYASASGAATPCAKYGRLNLAEWNGKSVFDLKGEWSFYWNALLTGTEIKASSVKPALVDVPGEWNYYKKGNGELPGFGFATYSLHVDGAHPGTEYGVRIQNEASAYKLYIDDTLIAENGTFGDTPAAPASAYRPRVVSFNIGADNFDIILQISNSAYAVGGMWEPVIFGTAAQVSAFDGALSDVGMFSFGGLTFICLFFFIFFVAQRRDKDVLSLVGIGVLIALRLLIAGDMLCIRLFPNMPISGFGLIDYLTLIWIQFLLLYFVYSVYGGIVLKWQIGALFSYCMLVSLAVLALPFEVVTAAYSVLNIILLFVTGFVTAQLVRAAWRGQAGAPVLLGAMAFILVFTLYALFVGIWPAGYYLLTATSIDYMVLFLAHCSVVAMRYNQAQKMELAFLKGQIHPHFIHNALTGIASSARTDPMRARELLLNMSKYLRGFYDYDSEEMITLKEELGLVKAYVNIEQMRFGESVRIEYEIESENLLLPPLILQPLVENAFVHGLREKEKGGMVIIYAKRMKNGKVRIGVKDNGPGMGAKPSATPRHGVGIKNINRRLLRLYRTQLVYTVPEGGGCETYMEIPWKEGDVKHESVSC